MAGIPFQWRGAGGQKGGGDEKVWQWKEDEDVKKRGSRGEENNDGGEDARGGGGDRVRPGQFRKKTSQGKCSRM